MQSFSRLVRNATFCVPLAAAAARAQFDQLIDSGLLSPTSENAMTHAALPIGRDIHALCEAARAALRSAAANTALFEMVEELQDWEKKEPI